MSRGRLALLVVLLAAAALWALRAPLALRVMDRALARNMGADPIAALPDGLHVLLCGAGGPLPDPVRSGPCAAVIAGRTLVVVDAGTGGARNLQRLGFAPGRLEALFLTHFHSDHIDGLGEMAMLRWTRRRARRAAAGVRARGRRRGGGGLRPRLPAGRHLPHRAPRPDGDAAVRRRHDRAALRAARAGRGARRVRGERPPRHGLRRRSRSRAAGRRLPLRVRRALARGERRHREVREPRGAGAGRGSARARGARAAAREAPARRGGGRRSRQRREDHQRHPRLPRHAGRGGRDRAGRRREAPALLPRDAAAAAAGARSRLPRRRLGRLRRRRHARARRHADLAAERAAARSRSRSDEGAAHARRALRAAAVLPVGAALPATTCPATRASGSTSSTKDRATRTRSSSACTASRPGRTCIAR